MKSRDWPGTVPILSCTGPTGSEKSTTLAAIIDQANKTRKVHHIITVADPH